MKVVYFGSHDDVASPRVRLLRDGLRRNGVEVVDCCAHGSALRRWPRLLQALPRAARNADLLLVAKPGQREMPLAAAAARALGLPVALDCFASLWLNEVVERRRVAPRSFSAWKLRALDRFALRHADLLLVDTLAHGRAILHAVGMSGAGAPMRRVFVGAEELFRPLPPRADDGRVEALWIGTYIPFHGANLVVQAAALLRNEPRLAITLLGDGQERQAAEALAAALRLPNLRFEPSLPIARLPERIARADLCLGTFGATPTAHAVIPKKVFTALACARPIVTADGEGLREALDESTAFLCRAGDPADLARVLRRALDDPRERAAIAERGHALHSRRFTPQATGAACAAALDELLAAHAATREVAT